MFTELFNTLGEGRRTAIDHFNPIEATVDCLFIFRFILQLS